MARRFNTSPFHFTNAEDIKLLGKAIAAVFTHNQATAADKVLAQAVAERYLVEDADAFKRQFDDFSDAHQRLTGRPTPQSKTSNYKKRDALAKAPILADALRQAGAGNLISWIGQAAPAPDPEHVPDQPQAAPASGLAPTGTLDGEPAISRAEATNSIEIIHEVIQDLAQEIDKQQDEIDRLKSRVTAHQHAERNAKHYTQRMIENLTGEMNKRLPPRTSAPAIIDAVGAAEQPPSSAAVISLRDRIKANRAKEIENTPEVLRRTLHA